MANNPFIPDGGFSSTTDPKLAKVLTDAEIASIRAKSEAHTSKASTWMLGIVMVLLAASGVVIVGLNPNSSKDVMLIISPLLVSIAGLLVGANKKRAQA